jgi:hypothetical protein
MSEDGGFLSRWSRRKAGVPDAPKVTVPATALPETPAPGAAATPATTIGAPAQVDVGATPVAAPALPSLDDVAQLTRGSDYSRFVAPGVDEGVKNAAMKKLFSDPHFNVMDGLDTYIDDYGKPDPIPMAMLRQMVQSHSLGLFDHEKDDAAAKAKPDPAQQSAPQVSKSDKTEPATPDEDPDLRLQQDDAAGRSRPDQGAGPTSV